mgnify:CR=1 FL=1
MLCDKDLIFIWKGLQVFMETETKQEVKESLYPIDVSRDGRFRIQYTIPGIQDDCEVEWDFLKQGEWASSYKEYGLGHAWNHKPYLTSYGKNALVEFFNLDETGLAKLTVPIENASPEILRGLANEL